MSWWMIDLGRNRAVRPTHYTLRHGYFRAMNLLRNWQFEGSNHGHVDGVWTTLHSGYLNTDMRKGYATYTWACDEIPVSDLTFYRFLRIKASMNSEGNYRLYLSGIEVYGHLIHKVAKSAKEGGDVLSTPRIGDIQRRLTQSARNAEQTENTNLVVPQKKHAPECVCPECNLQKMERDERKRAAEAVKSEAQEQKDMLGADVESMRMRTHFRKADNAWELNKMQALRYVRVFQKVHRKQVAQKQKRQQALLETIWGNLEVRREKKAKEESERREANMRANELQMMRHEEKQLRFVYKHQRLERARAQWTRRQVEKRDYRRKLLQQSFAALAAHRVEQRRHKHAKQLESHQLSLQHDAQARLRRETHRHRELREQAHYFQKGELMVFKLVLHHPFKLRIVPNQVALSTPIDPFQILENMKAKSRALDATGINKSKYGPAPAIGLSAAVGALDLHQQWVATAGDFRVFSHEKLFESHIIGATFVKSMSVKPSRERRKSLVEEAAEEAIAEAIGGGDAAAMAEDQKILFGKKSSADIDSFTEAEAAEAEAKKSEYVWRAGRPLLRATRKVKQGDVESELEAEGDWDVTNLMEAVTVFPSIVLSNTFLSVGKWYYEVTLEEVGSSLHIGWADARFTGDEDEGVEIGVGDDDSSWAFDGVGQLVSHNGQKRQWGAKGRRRWQAGDVIGFAADLDKKSFYCSCNGKWTSMEGGGKGFGNVRAVGGIRPAMSLDLGNKAQLMVNCGEKPFKHAPPSAAFLPVLDWSLEGFACPPQSLNGKYHISLKTDGTRLHVDSHGSVCERTLSQEDANTGNQSQDSDICAFELKGRADGSYNIFLVSGGDFIGGLLTLGDDFFLRVDPGEDPSDDPGSDDGDGDDGTCEKRERHRFVLQKQADDSFTIRYHATGRKVLLDRHVLLGSGVRQRNHAKGVVLAPKMRAQRIHQQTMREKARKGRFDPKSRRRGLPGEEEDDEDEDEEDEDEDGGGHALLCTCEVGAEAAKAMAQQEARARRHRQRLAKAVLHNEMVSVAGHGRGGGGGGGAGASASNSSSMRRRFKRQGQKRDTSRRRGSVVAFGAAEAAEEASDEYGVVDARVKQLEQEADRDHHCHFQLSKIVPALVPKEQTDWADADHSVPLWGGSKSSAGADDGDPLELSTGKFLDVGGSSGKDQDAGPYSWHPASSLVDRYLSGSHGLYHSVAKTAAHKTHLRAQASTEAGHAQAAGFDSHVKLLLESGGYINELGEFVSPEEEVERELKRKEAEFSKITVIIPAEAEAGGLDSKSQKAKEIAAQAKKNKNKNKGVRFADADADADVATSAPHKLRKQEPLGMSMAVRCDADVDYVTVVKLTRKDDGGMLRAERAGVHLGDRLVKINGVQIEPETVMAALRSASYPLALELRRGYVQTASTAASRRWRRMRQSNQAGMITRKHRHRKDPSMLDSKISKLQARVRGFLHRKAKNLDLSQVDEQVIRTLLPGMGVAVATVSTLKHVHAIETSQAMFVEQSRAAARLMVRPEQVIVSINGIPTAGLDYDQTAELLQTEMEEHSRKQTAWRRKRRAELDEQLKLELEQQALRGMGAATAAVAAVADAAGAGAFNRTRELHIEGVGVVNLNDDDAVVNGEGGSGNEEHAAPLTLLVAAPVPKVAHIESIDLALRVSVYEEPARTASEMMARTRERKKRARIRKASIISLRSPERRANLGLKPEQMQMRRQRPKRKSLIGLQAVPSGPQMPGFEEAEVELSLASGERGGGKHFDFKLFDNDKAPKPSTPPGDRKARIGLTAQEAERNMRVARQNLLPPELEIVTFRPGSSQDEGILLVEAGTRRPVCMWTWDSIVGCAYKHASGEPAQRYYDSNQYLATVRKHNAKSIETKLKLKRRRMRETAMGGLAVATDGLAGSGDVLGGSVEALDFEGDPEAMAKVYVDYEHQLIQLFSRFAPARLSHVPALLLEWEHREADLVAKLHTQYGIEEERPEYKEASVRSTLSEAVAKLPGMAALVADLDNPQAFAFSASSDHEGELLMLQVRGVGVFCFELITREDKDYDQDDLTEQTEVYHFAASVQARLKALGRKSVNVDLSAEGQRICDLFSLWDKQRHQAGARTIQSAFRSRNARDLRSAMSIVQARMDAAKMEQATIMLQRHVRRYNASNELDHRREERKAFNKAVVLVQNVFRKRQAWKLADAMRLIEANKRMGLELDASGVWRRRSHVEAEKPVDPQKMWAVRINSKTVPMRKATSCPYFGDILRERKDLQPAAVLHLKNQGKLKAELHSTGETDASGETLDLLLIPAQPVLALHTLSNAAAVRNQIVIVDRGGGPLDVKMQVVAQAGAAGVIVCNNDTMKPDEVPLVFQAGSSIPAAMVSYADGVWLKEQCRQHFAQLVRWTRRMDDGREAMLLEVQHARLRGQRAEEEAAEAEEEALQCKLWIALKLQAFFRAQQARRQVVEQINQRGIMMAMPGTIQGKTGWYQYGDEVAKFVVTEEEEWIVDENEETMTVSAWRKRMMEEAKALALRLHLEAIRRKEEEDARRQAREKLDANRERQRVARRQRKQLEENRKLRQSRRAAEARERERQRVHDVAVELERIVEDRLREAKAQHAERLASERRRKDLERREAEERKRKEREEREKKQEEGRKERQLRMLRKKEFSEQVQAEKEERERRKEQLLEMTEALERAEYERKMKLFLAVRVQAFARKLQTRRAIVREVNAEGKLLAMPGTVQGRSGWYQAGGMVSRFEVRGGKWSQVSQPVLVHEFRVRQYQEDRHSSAERARREAEESQQQATVAERRRVVKEEEGRKEKAIADLERTRQQHLEDVKTREIENEKARQIQAMVDSASQQVAEQFVVSHEQVISKTAEEQVLEKKSRGTVSTTQNALHAEAQEYRSVGIKGRRYSLVSTAPEVKVTQPQLKRLDR